jgi:hypothetical protein
MHEDHGQGRSPDQLRTTAGERAFERNLRGEPLPSAGTTHMSAERAYRTRSLSSHSTWSSTGHVSAKGVSFIVYKSSTCNRHLSPSHFLYARRVLSGEIDGHSTFSWSTRARRNRTSPSSRYVLSPVRSVA